MVKEDAEVAVKEEFAVSVDEGKGIIDFYYLFAGLGVLNIMFESSDNFF